MPDDHDMLAEYDFCKGIRGKYTARYSEGINVIDTAFDEGKAEGKAEGIEEGTLEVPRRLVDSGMSVEQAASIVGVPVALLRTS